MKHATSFRSLSLLSPALLVILVLLALSACGRGQPRPATSTPAPSVTATATLAQSTTTAMASATPTQTASQTPAEPALTPTATPVLMTTPAASAEAYRLQPWDRDTTLRMVEESYTVPIPEEYQNIRMFYRASLLYEALLKYPDFQNDPDFLKDMAQVKGLGGTYDSTYGLLHDHSVEPFRQLLENALNHGDTKLAALDSWIGSQGIGSSDPGIDTDHLFEPSIRAQVIKVEASAGWDLFVIRTDSPDHFSVLALYPEWVRHWWSDETFRITDLNANGRYEIAVTRDEWGIGMAHFCQRSFHLYEWDGKAFRNLMSDPLMVYQNTDFGECLDITFPPSPYGGYKIQAGTMLDTLCPEPFKHILRFAWNGRSFKKELDQTLLPRDTALPSRCTIDWALKAGPNNDMAMALLASALHNWPSEAENDWGPAARDYFRIKLATWYLQRGQLEQGLDLLKQTREHPFVSNYPLPARIATIFLDTYKAEGPNRAVQAVNTFYENEAKPYCGDQGTHFGCDSMKLRETWGFSEREWDRVCYGFQDDFNSIPTLLLTLKVNPPARLDELRTQLDYNKISYSWSSEGILDSKGNPDWMAIIERKRVDYNYKDLYAFMRQGKQILPVIVGFVYIDDDSSTEVYRWESFIPYAGTPTLIVFQAGPRLYVFHLRFKNGTYQIESDLNTWAISYSDEKDRVRVQDWRIESGKLIVRYEGRQGDTVYQWDTTQNKLIPTSYAPDFQEEYVGKIEQAIYFDNDPNRAIATLNTMFNGRIWENYTWVIGAGITNPPRVRPYMLYLLGLAYERSGDEIQAVRAYWQLWHDYPGNPYSLAAQSKLAPK